MRLVVYMEICTVCVYRYSNPYFYEIRSLLLPTPTQTCHRVFAVYLQDVEYGEFGEYVIYIYIYIYIYNFCDTLLEISSAETAAPY